MGTRVSQTEDSGLGFRALIPFPAHSLGTWASKTDQRSGPAKIAWGLLAGVRDIGHIKAVNGRGPQEKGGGALAAADSFRARDTERTRRSGWTLGPAEMEAQMAAGRVSAQGAGD